MTTYLPAGPPAAPDRSPRDAADGSAGAGWLRSTRAELLRLRRWPALWVLAGVWLALQTTFGFVVPYVAYRSGDPSPTTGAPPEQLLASMTADAVPRLMVQGTPLFGGALVMVLAALAVGSGYGWGTWKTVVTLGPGRRAALTGTVLALAGVVAGLVAATVVLDVGLATGVAAVEGVLLEWPDPAATARSAAGAALVLGTWAAAGVVLGVLSRNPALATGLGLVWSLVVENLLRGSGNLLPWLTPVTDHLPGAAAGSLAGALGAGTGAEGAPGVSTVLGGTAATGTLIAYLLVFLGVAATVFGRRDIT